MNTKVLAVELGLVRCRHDQPTTHLSPSSTVPHSQTWSLSQDANKKSGICRVCFATRQLHNKDGTIHRHGPRDNPCTGSHQLPLSDSVRSANIGVRFDIPATSLDSFSATSAAVSQAPVTSVLHEARHQSSSECMQHPVRSGSVLKRIPKNARVHVGNLLLKLVNDILQHPSSITSWSRLIGFPYACLVKPQHGGKSRNLTSAIIKQVQQYEAGTELNPAVVSQSTRRAMRRGQSVKTPEQHIAAAAATKLEDGDVRGAVRILCSDDKLAVVNATTLNELSRLHPPAPLDRRFMPSTVASPLQVFPIAIKKAIQSFPNGSAGGPDGLRPQHLKDLLLGAPEDHPLLVAITGLTNLQLEGNTPPCTKHAVRCNSSGNTQEDWWCTSHCRWLRLAPSDSQGCMLSCEGSKRNYPGAKAARFRDKRWSRGSGSSSQEIR